MMDKKGQEMVFKNKDDAAKELIRWHFQQEPYIERIFRILASNEDGAEEPIKLLEINSATLPTGRVEPFVFGPSNEIPFTVSIAEVTPTEFESLRTSPELLPDGWDLGKAEPHER